MKKLEYCFLCLFVLLLNVVGMTNSTAQGNHSYVDLDLPSGILWATCNVGANSPEEFGDYFAWGETQPKDVYDWSTYQYCNSSGSTLTKYCNNPNYGYNGFTDDLTTLSPEDDAATANWGGDWRMPTYDDWEELYQNTTHTWTTWNGVNGRLFTASNGNSLFLPASGYFDGNSLNLVGSDGNYWPSSLFTYDPTNAWRFDFGSDFYYMYYGSRSRGNSVRPVRSSQNNVPTGDINGKFTINADGDQVYFSQGNLQYQASTNTWRFAENQWDYVGDDTNGTVYENGVKSDNSLISATYAGWIDMFGWGTSGYNHGANSYQPWSISESYSDYYAYGSSNKHLYEQTGQADWGYNAISNGGNQENLWRSLSNAEWTYLLTTRHTTSGIRFAKAYLNGIAGLVIVPDNWNESVYAFSATNSASAPYNTNSISLTEWDNILQPAGVVFLPAAGSRKGAEISTRIDWGQYWTASCRSNSLAYPVSFSSSHLDPPDGYDNRFNGQTVRLVCSTSAVTSYSIEAVPNPSNGGTVTGTGAYIENQTCTLMAMPNEGYTFINWTEDDEMVSTNTTYSFTVTESRTLVANFAIQGNVPTGAINGLFSVSENNQVYFSQGNLQYKASTNTWKFAENQWDFVGEGNANASSTYEGWIDLFAWATSGYDHATGGYQPWSEGCNAYDGELLNLYDRTGKADWGYNAISNGGNQERIWRTCSDSEWHYLMLYRHTASGIRFAKAVVNGINGLVLLPDNWDASLYGLNNTNDGEAAYNCNVISLETWMSVFEGNGAVFLPASGRIESWVQNDFNLCGVYWYSTSHYVGYLKGRMIFGEDFMDLGAYFPSCHYSVRLVRAPANASYTIEAVSNPTNAGTVEGSGIYDYYTAAGLTAIPNEGYTFSCWKENGREVSTDNTYEVLALFDRSLEAAFYETSTYPLTYSYNENNHTATVTGLWEGVELEGELVIPEIVVHNGETYAVTTIAGRAFDGCIGLTSITFPNSIVSIESYAFYGCGLAEITIPSSVTSIGGVNPFGHCHSLAQITVESGNAYYDSRDNCNAIINTSTNCLISGSLNSVIPNSVTSLGQDAFYGIPFSSLTIYAEIPPIVGVYALADVYRDIPVYVPCGSLSAYQNAEGWSEFTNFIEMCGSIVTVTALSNGWNWASFNVNITLDDLKAALLAALPDADIIIKGQGGNTRYYPNINRWVGNLTIEKFDVAQMYKIQVPEFVEITLEGQPVNSAEHPIFVGAGKTVWISFPFSESRNLNTVFTGFCVDGDVVKAQGQSALYKGGRWVGNLSVLEPGKGYKYISGSSNDRMLIFPSNKK